MGLMRRAAVLVGQCDEEYQSSFLKGFFEEAFKRNFEVCVFAAYRKYQDTLVREASEAHIFELFEPGDYDAIVILRDSIQTPGVGDALEKRIHENFTGPVLVIDLKSEYFPAILTDGTEPCYRLVSHLIEKHGYKDIAYLTGKRWHEHSIARLDAYRKAMADHGLPVYEDRVIYGDFWYTSGEVAADQLLNGRGLPEAVACANDQMAIGLCKSLEARGYKVGTDIAVIGFDSVEEGRKCPHPLTSCILPSRDNGIYAATYIDDMLAGKTPAPYRARASLFIGESCGCTCEMISNPEIIRKNLLRSEWDSEISKEGFNSVYNSMTSNMVNESSLSSFLNLVYSYVYQLEGAESFSLCLCEYWKDIELNPDVIPDENGMSRKMVRAVCYGSDEVPDHADTSEIFDRRDLIPELKKRSTSPRAYFFTPFYLEDRCYGYGVISYGDRPEVYDRTYRQWMNLVAIGFDALRRRLIIKLLENSSQNVNRFVNVAHSSDIIIIPEDQLEFDLVKNILDNNLFVYNFQPIINVENGDIYSYEALMRSNTDIKISPLKIIKFAGVMGRLQDVEKYTFLNTLSFLDENREILGKRKLFINSIPGIRLDKASLDLTDALMMKHSENIVVEFTEQAELSDEDLERIRNRFSDLGVWTAVDDYGTGYSNVSNLLRYMPNIVKIDRSLLSGIQNNPQKKYFVKDIIDFCHQNGILALAEGVETSAELQVVIFLGADLIQGYYTGRPSPNLLPELDAELRKEIASYVKERDDGAIRYSYETGKTNRVNLSNISREGYTDIIIKEKNVVYKDITLIGAPGQQTELFVTVDDGYTGRLDLENVYLTAAGRHPCIELGENVNLTLALKGKSTFKSGGIRVPESSKITFEGEGSLMIDLETAPFGIGGGCDESCGELVFDQDGEIRIVTKSNKDVCIGSGLGGKIQIKRGKYLLECNGTECVGVGFIEGNNQIDIRSCLLEVRLNATRSAGIGSINGNTDIYIQYSTISITGGGQTSVGIGTIDGEIAVLNTLGANLEQSIRSIDACCFGSLNGQSRIFLKTSRINTFGNGDNMLAIGGRNGDVQAHIFESDVMFNINNELNVMCFAKPEDVVITMANNKKASLTLCAEPIDNLTQRKE